MAHAVDVDAEQDQDEADVEVVGRLAEYSDFCVATDQVVKGSSWGKTGLPHQYPHNHQHYINHQQHRPIPRRRAFLIKALGHITARLIEIQPNIQGHCAINPHHPLIKAGPQFHRPEQYEGGDADGFQFKQVVGVDEVGEGEQGGEQAEDAVGEAVDLDEVVEHQGQGAGGEDGAEEGLEELGH